MGDMEFPDKQLSQLLTGIQAKISVKHWFCHSYSPNTDYIKSYLYLIQIYTSTLKKNNDFNHFSTNQRMHKQMNWGLVVFPMIPWGKHKKIRLSGVKVIS